MSVRHILSTRELGADELARLVDRSLDYARDGARGRPLAGRTVGIYFRRPSTRTRTAFTVAAQRLGADVVTYGAGDLQLVTGESLGDTARILSGMLDALVIRTNEELAEMRSLASQETMAVVNALSVEEHPTQAIADLAALKEAFGRLEGLHVLYLGGGYNTAAALAVAVAQTPGMRLTLATPERYSLEPELAAAARELAAAHGSVVEERHRADDLPRVDAVYTTRWRSMGAPMEGDEWRREFEPFAVTPELMERVASPSGTIFLHDLPAERGADVADAVIDGPRSRVWRQAEFKFFGAMSVLEWCILGDATGAAREGSQ